MGGGGGGGKNVCHRCVYIAHSSDFSLLTLSDSKEIWGCFLMSGLWSENAALFKRLMNIHSNLPILYYGFNFNHNSI